MYLTRIPTHPILIKIVWLPLQTGETFFKLTFLQKSYIHSDLTSTFLTHYSSYILLYTPYNFECLISVELKKYRKSDSDFSESTYKTFCNGKPINLYYYGYNKALQFRLRFTLHFLDVCLVKASNNSVSLILFFCFFLSHNVLFL